MTEQVALPNGCEEASIHSIEKYIPCNARATKLIFSPRDNHTYRMCDPCAYHSVKNRGMEDRGDYMPVVPVVESGFLEQVARDASQTKEIPRDEQLGVLAQKAEKQVELEDEIAQVEQKLKDLKAECAKIAELDIPDLMHELGVEDFTLKNGLKVKVSAFYGAKIPEELADEAFDWLEDNKHEAIIKGEFVVMYKRPDKQRLGRFYELAKEMGFEVKDKLNVHPMTLKAFVKEQITEGHDLPRNLFGVYTGWRTKITKR